MSKRWQNQDGAAISLFPFLAVLVCTMGALLVLLVVLARRAQANAQTDMANQQQSSESNQQRLDEITADIDRFRHSREQARQALLTRREMLAHREDHTRRLRDQIVQLRNAARQLGTIDTRKHEDRARVAAELARVQSDLEKSERLLAEAIQQAAGRQPSYSIVPYDGQSKTQRRPIYLECLANSIVIQPEGIELSESDFLPPLGPDSPLPATLRAASEYLYSQSTVHPSNRSRPYPLVLVRPAGIPSYYATRAAMRSWDDEFGYELVETEWKLKFPPPDPELAQVMNDALERARRRQQLSAGSTGPSRWQLTQDRSGRPGFGRMTNEGHGGATSSGSRSELSRGADGDQRTDSTSKPGGVSSPSRAGVTQSPQDNTGQAAIGSPQPTPQSLADTRGQDWALPSADRGSVPFTRPIRIECSATRLVLVSPDGRTMEKEIPITGNTKDTIEQFVSAVWDHMRDWGIAGRGMYWRPELRLYVLPGGDRRARDMKNLLKDSGLDVSIQK